VDAESAEAQSYQQSLTKARTELTKVREVVKNAKAELARKKPMLVKKTAQLKSMSDGGGQGQADFDQLVDKLNNLEVRRL